MAKHMKRFLVAAAVLATPLLSPCVRSDTIRLDMVKALDLREDDHGFDRLRIVYRVDGGPEQSLARRMRHGDEWKIGLTITFNDEVTFVLYEDGKDFVVYRKRPARLGIFTVSSGQIATDKTHEQDLHSRWNSHYWVLIGGSGTYVAPTPPVPRYVAPRPVWLDGGTFTSPDLASEAGQKLVTAGVAEEFRVDQGVQFHDVGPTRVVYPVWYLKYLPKPKA